MRALAAATLVCEHVAQLQVAAEFFGGVSGASAPADLGTNLGTKISETAETGPCERVSAQR